MRILAIDPGNTASGVALIDSDTCAPIYVDKIDNGSLLQLIVRGSEKIDADKVVVEMVASYGMAVGREVFDTCVWIGRFVESAWSFGDDCRLIKRAPVKVHHCHHLLLRQGPGSTGTLRGPQGAVNYLQEWNGSPRPSGPPAPCWQ